jgi:anti-sigma B factor antagonist
LPVGLVRHRIRRGYPTSDEGWPLSAAEPITTSVAHRDGAAVVSVGGEIDLSTAPAFERAIAEALEADPPVLAIELSNVTFMASVGLRILAATNEKIGASTRIAVIADNKAATRPIQLTGLDTVVALYPTLNEALAELSE